MEADLTLPRKSGDPLHLGKIEDFTPDPADRGFDRDHPDRRRCASVLGAGGLGLDLSKAEGRAFCGQRDESQPAQRLRAVSRIIVDVALALDQNAAAALRKKSQREVVGQGSARQKHRHLLAEQRRHAVFELGHHPLRAKIRRRRRRDPSLAEPANSRIRRATTPDHQSENARCDRRRTHACLGPPRSIAPMVEVHLGSYTALISN
jgi:hypothetical protein